MSVRKRSWKTNAGEGRESWVVDYVDGQGDRHIATFPRKKEADAFHATVRVDVGRGVHTPHSKSLTVAEAAERWITHVEVEGRERSTVAQYRQHTLRHINPRLGREKLASLTMPRINAFKDDLLAHMSRAMARARCL
jgi:integrase